MRYAIGLAVVGVLGLALAAPPAQAGTREDCAQFKNPDLAIRACGELIRRNPRDSFPTTSGATPTMPAASTIVPSPTTARPLGSTRAMPRLPGTGHRVPPEGRPRPAIADLDEAIRLGPGDAIAYSARGSAYTLKRDYDRAIADHSEAIRLNPRHALAYRERATAYWWKRDYDRAIADYNEAIRLSASDAAAYAFRGNIADYNVAIRLNPSDAAPFNNRGVAYTRKGDYDRAIADLSEAIRVAPRLGGPYRNRGTAYSRKGEHDRAMADHDEAVRLDPTSAIAFARRGQTWEAKGDRLRAIEDYGKALALPAPTQQARDEQAEAKQRLAALLSAPQTAAPAVARPSRPMGRRVALVIGNAAYRTVKACPTRSRMPAAWRRRSGRRALPMSVERHDLAVRDMQRELATFEDKATGADWAVVYYAGHGIEVDGRNYLIPVDAELKRASDVEDETVALAGCSHAWASRASCSS